MISRQDLIQLCVDGVVQEKDWTDRDSAKSQIQLGEACALLMAGCDFRVLTGEVKSSPTSHLVSDADTWWIEIFYEGFGYYETFSSEDTEEERLSYRQSKTAYIPTRQRLNDRVGKDWY